MTDYIFTMKAVTKVHPPDKKVIEDLYLSFIPGAKIGVIGPNGAGKSTLLRIMAGEDTTHGGEAWRKPGATLGYVKQEPDIGKDRTVLDVVNEAVQPMKKALADAQLQHAMTETGPRFIIKRSKARDALPEFDRLRDISRDIKNNVLDNLDIYLERYEKKSFGWYAEVIRTNGASLTR